MTSEERSHEKALVELAPSILSADFARLADEVHAVEEGGASVVHVDGNRESWVRCHFLTRYESNSLITSGSAKTLR